MFVQSESRKWLTLNWLRTIVSPPPPPRTNEPMQLRIPARNSNKRDEDRMQLRIPARGKSKNKENEFRLSVPGPAQRQRKKEERVQLMVRLQLLNSGGELNNEISILFRFLAARLAWLATVSAPRCPS
jgi:hypothetical protein